MVTFFKLIGKSLDTVGEKKQRRLTLTSDLTLNSLCTIIWECPDSHSEWTYICVHQQLEVDEEKMHTLRHSQGAG